MGSLSDASTYRAQKRNWLPIHTFPYFFLLFSRTPTCAPFSHRLSHSFRSIFPFSLFGLANRQLARHIWPVISKMSNKMMHTRVPRSHEIKVADLCTFAFRSTFVLSSFSLITMAPCSSDPVLSSIRSSSISFD